MLDLLLIGAAGVFGFLAARRFVRGRLRFVDAVYSPAAPFIAAVVAALVAWPVAAILPVITTTSAALFAIGVGMGTSTGVRDLKRLALPR